MPSSFLFTSVRFKIKFNNITVFNFELLHCSEITRIVQEVHTKFFADIYEL